MQSICCNTRATTTPTSSVEHRQECSCSRETKASYVVSSCSPFTAVSPHRLVLIVIVMLSTAPAPQQQHQLVDFLSIRADGASPHISVLRSGSLDARALALIRPATRHASLALAPRKAVPAPAHESGTSRLAFCRGETDDSLETHATFRGLSMPDSLSAQTCATCRHPVQDSVKSRALRTAASPSRLT